MKVKVYFNQAQVALGADIPGERCFQGDYYASEFMLLEEGQRIVGRTFRELEEEATDARHVRRHLQRMGIAAGKDL